MKYPENQASWMEFAQACWEPIHQAALQAGLTQAHAEKVLKDVLLCVAEKLPPCRDPSDESSLRDWIDDLIRWRIGEHRKLQEIQAQLVGVWCASLFGEREGPGDEFLTFWANGTGRADLRCLRTRESSEFESTRFRWSIPRPGSLTVVGIQSFRFSFDQAPYDIQDSPDYFREVPYGIAVETSLRGRTMPVFRADLWLPREIGFGLVRKDLSEHDAEHSLADEVPR